MCDTVNDIEKLYSPSKWSKRLSEDVICEKHLEFITRESDRIRGSIPSTLNVSYGPGTREKFDIFGTDLRDDSPIFIFIHGGYWQEKDLTHDVQSFVAENLYNNGIKTICIGYELCPNVTLPELMINIEVAVNKCLEYAKKLGARSIHLAGHSAGAHLVLSLYTNYIKTLPQEDQNLFKSAFLLCGIYDLLPLLETSYNVPLKLDKESANSASMMFQNIMQSDQTKFFVVAAENDSPAFVQQSRGIHEKLLKLGNDSEYKVVEVDHFDVIENLVDNDFVLTRYLIKNIMGQL